MIDITVHVTAYADRDNLVLWWVDPVTEKRRTKSAGTSDRRQAERAAAALEAELRANRTQDARLTWVEFRERVEDEFLPGLAPRTRSSYATAMNSVENHLAPARLAAFANPAGLAAYTKSLRQKKRPKPLSETTIAGYLRHLHRLMTWAKSAGLIAEVPTFPKLRTGRRNAALRGRPITAEEFDRLIENTPNICQTYATLWQHYLRGLWWSGLRLSESLIISWDQTEPFCIDTSGQFPMLRIYAEGQKSRRDQLYPIAPEFAEFLEATPTDRRHGQLFRLPHPTTGRILTAVYDVSDVVCAIGKAANIITTEGSFASAHDLRRSFGLRWARRVKAHVLRQLMRHKSLETTMKYYVREDATELAAELYRSTNSSTIAESTV